MNELGCSFLGQAKVDGVGLFEMDTKDVCAKVAQPLRNLNNMCQFENYAGRYFLYEEIYLTCLSCS